MVIVINTHESSDKGL